MSAAAKDHSSLYPYQSSQISQAHRSCLLESDVPAAVPEFRSRYNAMSISVKFMAFFYLKQKVSSAWTLPQLDHSNVRIVLPLIKQPRESSSRRHRDAMLTYVYPLKQ